VPPEDLSGVLRAGVTAIPWSRSDRLDDYVKRPARTRHPTFLPILSSGAEDRKNGGEGDEESPADHGRETALGDRTG